MPVRNLLNSALPVLLGSQGRPVLTEPTETRAHRAPMEPTTRRLDRLSADEVMTWHQVVRGGAALRVLLDLPAVLEPTEKREAPVDRACLDEEVHLADTE